MSGAPSHTLSVHVDLASVVARVKALEDPVAVELLSATISDVVSMSLQAYRQLVLQASMSTQLWQDCLYEAGKVGFNIGRTRGRSEVVLPENFSAVLGDAIGRSLGEAKPAQGQVVVNVTPAPVQIENKVQVNPTPVTIDNQVVVPARRVVATPNSDGSVTMTPEDL